MGPRVKVLSTLTTEVLTETTLSGPEIAGFRFSCYCGLVLNSNLYYQFKGHKDPLLWPLLIWYSFSIKPVLFNPSPRSQRVTRGSDRDLSVKGCQLRSGNKRKNPKTVLSRREEVRWERRSDFAKQESISINRQEVTDKNSYFLGRGH